MLHTCAANFITVVFRENFLNLNTVLRRRLLQLVLLRCTTGTPASRMCFAENSDEETAV
jgi:hypothetical protein